MLIWGKTGAISSWQARVDFKRKRCCLLRRDCGENNCCRSYLTGSDISGLLIRARCGGQYSHRPPASPQSLAWRCCRCCSCRQPRPGDAYATTEHVSDAALVSSYWCWCWCCCRSSCNQQWVTTCKALGGCGWLDQPLPSPLQSLQPSTSTLKLPGGSDVGFERS